LILLVVVLVVQLELLAHKELLEFKAQLAAQAQRESKVFKARQELQELDQLARQALQVVKEALGQQV
jgi:hypothetical protein